MGQCYESSYLRHNEEQRDGEKRRQSRKENTKAAQVFSIVEVISSAQLIQANKNSINNCIELPQAYSVLRATIK